MQKRVIAVADFATPKRRLLIPDVKFLTADRSPSRKLHKALLDQYFVIGVEALTGFILVDQTKGLYKSLLSTICARRLIQRSSFIRVPSSNRT